MNYLFSLSLSHFYSMTFTIQPIKPTAKQSGVDFGAIIEDLDLETITRKK
jgi:hypothetical protein